MTLSNNHIEYSGQWQINILGEIGFLEKIFGAVKHPYLYLKSCSCYFNSYIGRIPQSCFSIVNGEASVVL